MDAVTPRRNNLSLLERRHLLLGGAALAVAPALHGQATTGTLLRTPQQSLGPFYPRSAGERPSETDADLLLVEAGRVKTRGVPIFLSGRVVDLRGQPLASATIEIWQCDANAVYHHPAGGAEEQRDPAFQGYGVAQSNGAGEFAFRTIRPVAYPGRTPHIHVRVQAGRTSLATQLYLPDDPGNARDFLFSRLAPQEQAALLLRMTPTSSSAAHPLARNTLSSAWVELALG